MFLCYVGAKFLTMVGVFTYPPPLYKTLIFFLLGVDIARFIPIL